MNLKLSKSLLSKTNALQYVYALLEEIYGRKILERLPETISIPNSKGTWEINIEKEIEFIRINGQGDVLQYAYDCTDKYLSPVLELGQDGDGITKSLTMESRFGTCVKVLKTNGIISAPEKSIADDICYFRELFVDACNNKDSKMYSRAYRAYLMNSISMIECFLQRYIFYINSINPIIKDRDLFDILKSTAPIEERVKVWLKLFTSKEEKDLISTKEWSQFLEIKRQRNLIIHPTEPMICYEVKKMITILNNEMHGIGGLLILLRQFENGKDYIGFFRKLFNQNKIEIA